MSLTVPEHDVIHELGIVYTRIATEIIGHGPTRDADLAEAAAAVHVLQRMIMANAAARLYPKELRLLGERVHP